ncbi:MAG: GNAT family N-acetyltransferase [Clostridia bacterium]
MTQAQVIDTEIRPKGKCYIICTEYSRADFCATIDALCDTAAARGARHIYFASRDKRVLQDEMHFETSEYLFKFHTDFDILTKALAPQEEPHLAVMPLTDNNAMLYAKIYNRAFRDVPNSSTMDRAEIAHIMEDNSSQAGIFMNDETPCGVYLIEYGGTPELAALCIHRPMWGKGLARRALATLEDMLYKKGHKRIKLLVAGLNKTAYSLYTKNGYSFSERISHWYEAEKK